MAKAPRKYSIADVLGFGAAAPRSLASGLQREYRRMPRNAPIKGGIRPTKPTATQELVQLLTPNTRAGNEFANKLAPAIDMSPIGVLMGLVDARRAYEAGNTGQAAGVGLLAAIGGVPGAKLGGRAAKEVAETAAERGIIAYHGSPHSFNRFDMSKIGTGQGAQAYGRGGYFAEAEDVAKKYRDELTGAINANANRAIKQTGDIDAAIARAKDRIDAYSKMDDDRAASLLQINKQELDQLLRMKEGDDALKGSMYKVKINAENKDFLDWDKPIKDQASTFSEYVKNYNALAGSDVIDPSMAGGDFYNQMSRRLLREGTPSSAVPTEISNFLASQGVKGIKYLDAGSRGAANKTSNFVVFDDALIDILKKYGIAIPALAGGGLLATQPQQNGGI